MVEVPAGSFWMGCNEDTDDECHADEFPYHEVYISGYLIDRTEVTQWGYWACVAAGVCSLPADPSFGEPEFLPCETPNYPVSGVTWYKATTFCDWLGKSLPTEAQWEKAARGNSGQKYPWGNNEPDCETVATNNEDCEISGMVWVCSRSPAGDSQYGLCDMSGNVNEWVYDWYGPTFYSVVPPVIDPSGPVSGTEKVARGGTRWDTGHKLSVSDRVNIDPTNMTLRQGFRCVVGPYLLN
jgi:formylglycine-generating enzyme